MHPYLSALVALLLATAGSLFGQEKPTEVKLTEAEKKFEAQVVAADRFLSEHTPYAVAIESTWKGSGHGQDREGKNVFRLVVGKDRKQFRIEAGTGKDKHPALVVVSDGKSVSRLYVPGKIYSQHACDDPFAEVGRDALTASSLEGSGIDFLVRKDVRGYLLSQTVSVQDMGDVKLDGKPAQQFRITLANKRVVDVWFPEGDNHLVRRLAMTLEIPVKEKEIYRMTITTRFDWDTKPKLEGNEFALTLSEGARKVDNILAALNQADGRELVGKPAPELRLTGIDGKEVRPADHKGKGVSVLYLWATWCAPSTDDMPDLNKFVEGYEKKGVEFLAINVDEKEDLVKPAVEKRGYKGKVALDPKGTSLEAYRLAVIPAVVLIDKDGTVQAIHTGGGSGLREKVRKDLDALLKGERLVPEGKK
jgi:peroxiredoxin